MSEPQELSLDLEKAFLPAWAQKPADPNRYSRFEGQDGGRRDDRNRNDRGPRRGFGGGPGRGPGGPGGGGGGGFGRGPGGNRGPSGPAPGTPRTGVAPGAPAPNLNWDPAAAPRGDRGGPRGNRGPDRGPDRGPRRRDDFDRRPEPLIPVDCTFIPEPNGVASLARQIRLSCRAYPLFEVAGLVMQKPDRYEISLRVIKGKDGQPQQPLFVCSLDDTVWLSETEALKQTLATHFDTFYATEKQATEPPKGTYTFVAQCGISGEVLGPPNYHGYQEKLRRLHAERFNRMPFEAYKARVRIVKDEAVVKQWLENQSFRLEYTTLNVPEPRRITSREEVEQHFRETHLPNLIRPVDSVIVRKETQAKLPAPLQTLIRVGIDRERRFPIKVATALSNAFASAGLQFFKRDKTIVHVAVARPHHLDLENQVVSEGVKKIISHIEAHPKTTRKALIDALAPLPPEAPVPVPAPIPVAPSEPVAEGAAAPVEGGATPVAAAPAPAAPVVHPEREVVLTDLHWLLHQGHVIEFANGVIELAKKPGGRPEGGEAAPANAPAGQRQPRNREGREGQDGKRERGPRPDRTPWSRKHGLLPTTTPGYPAYTALPQLIGL